jgi:hypothetical protein
MKDSARDLYLSSLDARSELNARRLAELSHIPADDPMWLLMHETQRSVREAIGGANAVLANEAFAQRLSTTVAGSICRDERVIASLTGSVEHIHNAASRAIRSLETALHEMARRRAAAPFASLAFAFALGLIVCSAVVWAAFRVGADHGYDVGYRVGYHDGVIYDRTQK